MKKKVSVVTGANGFVGSHMVEYLLTQGHEVRCIVRKTSNMQWLKGLDVQLFDCGLNDIEALSVALNGANYVYHIAGAVGASSYEKYLYGNVQLTENVLEACEKNSEIQRIIITSSLAASASASLNQPVTELTPSNPISQYGKSKVTMEQMVKEKYSHLPYVIIRPPAVYGARDTGVLTLFKMANKGFFTKIGASEKQASLVYVKDLVEGLYLASMSPNALQQTYFLTSDVMPTWTEVGQAMGISLGKKVKQFSIPHSVVFMLGNVLEIIGKLQGKTPTINKEKAKEITQEAWICSAEKASKELGYQAKYPMAKGFAETVQWYKEQSWL